MRIGATHKGRLRPIRTVQTNHRDQTGHGDEVDEVPIFIQNHT